MRGKHRAENLHQMKEQGPDCCTCIHRKGCERYAENSFCGRWQSREPEDRVPDPNKLWETGEEVEF